MDRLEKVDPQIARIIRAEQRRQTETLELIASENHVSPAVLVALGSVLTDKYAEGYPRRRCYCGNENIDSAEQLCIDRAKELFGADHANVQAHTGSQANMAAYYAVLDHGDIILSLSVDHGGHLSHGEATNFSGRYYRVHHYALDRDTELLDYESARKIA